VNNILRNGVNDEKLKDNLLKLGSAVKDKNEKEEYYKESTIIHLKEYKPPDFLSLSLLNYKIQE